jgi:predicted dehydrogenase
MSDLVRIGIIGCGAGRLHAREYVTMNDVELVALAGLEEDRCREVTANSSGPSARARPSRPPQRRDCESCG